MFKIAIKQFLFLTILFTSLVASSSDNLKNVTLQLQWQDQFQFAGYYMAKEKGFYKDVGLHVELLPFKNNLHAVDEVISKRATYGIGRSSLLIDRDEGKKISFLAAILQSSPLVFLTTDLSIKNVKDFKSKKIMLDNNELKSASLQAMIYKSGITKDDIKIAKHTFNVDDLIDKKVDVITAYLSNEPYELKQKGVKYNIFNPSDYGFDFYEDILFTSDEEFKNNPHRTEDFVDASLRGWQYAFDNIEESVDIIFNKYNSQNKSKKDLRYEANELKKLAYIGISKSDLGHIDKNKITRIFDIYNILGLVNNNSINDNFIRTRHSHAYINATKDEKNYLDIKQSIRMCVDPNWMPFEAIKDGKHIGMSSDYMKIVEHLVGMKIELIPTKTWSQSLEYIKNKKCDILSLTMNTPKREKFLRVTKPYFTPQLVFTTKKDKFYISNMEDIKDEKIGIVKDYSILELLRVEYPKIDFVEVENTEDGLHKVLSGKIYALIDNITIISYEIKKNYSNSLKISGQLDFHYELGIGVRSDDEILLNILNKIVKSIDEEKTNEITNRYIKVNYEHSFDYRLFWKIIAILALLLLFFIYRQYELKKYNNELEKKVAQAVEEAKRNEKLLQRQARLAQMGEMLSMIAHQWRQPLGIISATTMGIEINLSLDKYDLSNDEKREEFKKYLNKKIKNINKHTQFLSTTIDDFRTFFLPNKEKELVPITQPIKRAVDLVSTSLKNSNIQLVLDFSTNDDILIYQNELMHVILNIIKNAEEHLLLVKRENGAIHISALKLEKDYIITICDNAGGINESIIDLIFDPYFSTKDEKNGSGLGLYMSKVMVEEHNDGVIGVKNSEEGACFTIKFKATV